MPRLSDLVIPGSCAQAHAELFNYMCRHVGNTTCYRLSMSKKKKKILSGCARWTKIVYATFNLLALSAAIARRCERRQRVSVVEGTVKYADSADRADAFNHDWPTRVKCRRYIASPRSRYETTKRKRRVRKKKRMSAREKLRRQMGEKRDNAATAGLAKKRTSRAAAAASKARRVVMKIPPTKGAARHVCASRV